MPITTLTTDFGLKDYYVGLVKGALLSKNPDLRIVDITHNVNAYDIVQGAFILRNCYAEYPVGTIHIISVGDYSQAKPCFLAIRYAGHYFIGPDNGVFSLLFDHKLTRDIYELAYAENNTFPLKNVFADAVEHLLSDLPFNEIGIPIDAIDERITFQPVTGPSLIKGAVIHIDNYQNVITNIGRDVFDRVGQGRKFALYFQRHNPITRMSRYYTDVAVGETLCFFNSAGCLEIAINMGKAAELHGLKVEDAVEVTFK